MFDEFCFSLLSTLLSPDNVRMFNFCISFFVLPCLVSPWGHISKLPWYVFDREDLSRPSFLAPVCTPVCCATICLVNQKHQQRHWAESASEQSLLGIHTRITVWETLAY